MLTRHSSISMSWNWSSAKCRQSKSLDTWYNIVICATRCVNFSSKSKPSNVSPKHILKTLDKIFQARKKLFCHVIVKNYLCNVLPKFLIKFESTWRREIKLETPYLTSLYCSRTVRSSLRRFSIKKQFFEKFTISTGNTCAGVTFKKCCKFEGLQLH